MSAADTHAGVGRLSAAYLAGYDAGWGGGPYDERLVADPDYRQGMQDGRTNRIDADLLARFGPNPTPDAVGGGLHRWWPGPTGTPHPATWPGGAS